MRVVRLMDEPDWQSRLSPIEEIFFATSPSRSACPLCADFVAEVSDDG